MMEIQYTMSERAVELLGLPEGQPCHLLDLGCGSGLSGETLTEQGHTWTGVDISGAMLSKFKNIIVITRLQCQLSIMCSIELIKLICWIITLGVAKEREVEGDLAMVDLGEGLPFRAGSFDGAISISALQWLCNADKTCHNPAKRLYKLFSTLYSCLVKPTNWMMSGKEINVIDCLPESR